MSLLCGALDQGRLQQQRFNGLELAARGRGRGGGGTLPKGGAPVHINGKGHIGLGRRRHSAPQGSSGRRRSQRDRAHQQPAGCRQQGAERRRHGTGIQGLIGKAGAPFPGKTLKLPLSGGIPPHQHDAAGTIRIPLQAPLIHSPRRKQCRKRLAGGIAAQPSHKGAGGAQAGQGTRHIGRGPTQSVQATRRLKGRISTQRSETVEQGFTEANHLGQRRHQRCSSAAMMRALAAGNG